jgi:hypothetical protein
MCQSCGWIGHRTISSLPAACAAGRQQGLARGHFEASAARWSDTAGLENGVRQHAVEASRAIVSGPIVSSSHIKEPTTDLIAAATGGEMGSGPVACRQIRPVAGVSRAWGTPNSAGAVKSWLEVEIDDAPLHSTGSIRKSTKRIRSTRKTASEGCRVQTAAKRTVSPGAGRVAVRSLSQKSHAPGLPSGRPTSAR